MVNPVSSAPRILAVVGSPRRAGNCDSLVELAAAAASALGAAVKTVHLDELTIAPCSACDACRPPGGGARQCTVDDNMQPLYAELSACDALLIATPVYWWGASAQTKLFVDRWYGVADRPATFGGLPLALIVSSGDGTASMADYVLRPFRAIASYLRMRWVGELAVAGRPVGKITQDPEAVTRAQDLGRRLAEAAGRRRAQRPAEQGGV